MLGDSETGSRGQRHQPPRGEGADGGSGRFLGMVHLYTASSILSSVRELGSFKCYRTSECLCFFSRMDCAGFHPQVIVSLVNVWKC